ncbi:AAA family ATPase [Roseomonas sp. BN140053]|uniref:AAA family ATPase n=1 Tax=Roseomonas sp. BN140053 TaxID=3391898 RepID=UPI0039EB7E31
MRAASPEERLRDHGARTQKGPVPQLVLIDPRNWKGFAPPRRWVVQDWLPANAVTALYGDGGIGKSLLAQQLLTSMALHLPWCGIDVSGGRALGIFCEDSEEELQRRQEAINNQLGVRMADLADLRLLSRLGEDNAMVSFDKEQRSLTEFAEQVSAACEDFRPALLALDTAADLYPDNENDRSKVRWFIGSLAKLALQHRCGVLLLAHPSQSGLATGQGTGGSTAWNNTVRSRLYLDRPDAEDQDARLLRRMKANYAARGGEVRLRWHEGVLRSEGSEAREDGASWDTIRALFRAIDEAWNAGKPMSLVKQTRSSGRYFPTIARKLHQVPEKQAAQLAEDWIINRYLSVDLADAKTHARGLRVLRWLGPNGAEAPPAADQTG